MQKLITTFCLMAAACSLTACISVSDYKDENGKQISAMSQQAISTCGAGNVDKVTTTSYTCKGNK